MIIGFLVLFKQSSKREMIMAWLRVVADKVVKSD